MVFQLKYLGMTLVEKPKGEDMAAAAIRRIITMARAEAKKFQKVTLTVSPRGILLQDSETNEMIENISIYRISYCTTDKVQNKVFAYVAQNQSNETLECHAFLSPKKKIAQAVALTVAQAFRVALDLWEATQGRRSACPTCPSSCCVSQPESCCRASPCDSELGSRHRNALLVSDKPSINPLCSADSVQPHCTTELQASISGSPFRAHSGEEDEDDEEEDLEEAFSRLAKSRTGNWEPCFTVIKELMG
nr:low density lipoprotein receptor adapter protein 1-B-like isoform X2 [Geotrypetes seraphini]XP_033791623.1 low density lipoprotein receptor adapter protein 1-B-like isoform X2 [Geotrypetes seraphini]